MGLFHRLARMHHHRGHHHSHNCHHEGDEASRVEHIADRVAGGLDLNEAQQAKLVTLLEAVQVQRAAIKSPDLVKDLAGLVKAERFDREAADAWIAQRLQAVQTGAPSVLTALGDFYDALDTEQQQALRFMLRMGGRFGRGGGGGGGKWRRHWA